MVFALVGYLLAAVFFALSVILMIKLNKKRKPVWTYSTTNIIELGATDPTELELLYKKESVSDVYKTSIIVKNKGNEAIRDNDVILNITLLFVGAKILDEPNIIKISNENTKFSAKHLLDEAGNKIELNFLYLDAGDWAEMEVIHTKCDEIKCNGTIIGVKEIKYISKYSALTPSLLRWDSNDIRNLSIGIPLLVIGIILLTNWNWEGLPPEGYAGGSLLIGSIFMLTFVTTIWGVYFISLTAIKYIKKGLSMIE